MATWYYRNQLTGGTSDSVDGIGGDNLANLDVCVVFRETEQDTLFYILDEDSGAAESSPNVIVPDVNAGDKRWILQGIYASSGTLATNGGSVITNEGSGEYTMSIDTNGIPYLKEV